MIINRIKNFIVSICKKRIIYRNRQKLKNQNPTVIASNCNGGCILHDLGLRFNSPFVNLWVKPKDFIKLLSDFDNYMSADLVESHEEGIEYPIGKVLDVTVYFQHYSSFDDAVAKWNERKQRINKDNLFVIFTDRDGCTYEDLINFDSLPMPNKIVLTHKPYDDIESAFYIKGFENMNSVGMCFDYMPTKKWMKYYNQFDFVAWFNSNVK